MSAQFRKSKKVGPFRLTATKSGLSLSTGAGPLRWSANTRGEVRRTTRIPGTGIYSTKKVAKISGDNATETVRDSNDKTPVTQQEYKKNMAIIAVFFAIVSAVIFGIVTAIFGFSWWVVGAFIFVYVVAVVGSRSAYDVVDEEELPQSDNTCDQS